MTPANHGVAKIPGTMSIIVDEDGTVMFNDGADTHFIMQNIKPSDALVLAGKLGEQQDESGEKTGHLIVFCTNEANERLSHDWIALRNELDSVDVNVLPDGVLPKLAVTVAAGHGVNLLQGKYGKKTEYAALFRPWKLAATLLLGFAASWILFKGVAYNQMLDEKEALLAQFTTEYRAIRPNDTSTISDPGAMVNSLRRSVGGPSAPQVFLPSIRQIGDALSDNSGAVLEAVSYRAGVIDLRLTAPDVSTLDNIQKAISASGRFEASIQRTDQVADKIDGRIQIRETGS
jgi:general secretion pathway protein L